MNEAPQVPAGVDDIPMADSAAQVWHRSGRGGGAIEVAFVQASGTHSTASADAPE